MNTISISKWFATYILAPIVSLFGGNNDTYTQKNNSDSVNIIVEQAPVKVIDFDKPLPESSANFKSLRLITGQTTATLPKGTFEVSIQHRFGTISSGAENLWGIDNLNSMRIGFDFAVGNRLTIGAGRSSLQKTYNSYAKWNLIGGFDKKFQLSLLSDLAVDGRRNADWGLDPYFFTHRMMFTNQLLASYQMGENLVLGVSPGVVHFNLVDASDRSNTMPVISAYSRLQLIPKLALTAEASTIIQGLNNPYEKSTPTYGIGFEYFTPRHVFQINLTNSRSMNEPYFLVTDPTLASINQFCLGFNLIRRW